MGHDIEGQSGDVDLSPAHFSDRVVAFSSDMAIFIGGYFLTLHLAFPAYSVWVNPHAVQWRAVWTALFLLYHAFFSADGRVSVGKKLAGIRIVSAEGEPLTLGESLLRSGLYLISSVLNLGFLWALFNPAHQAWHDMAVGSMVVDSRPKGHGHRLALRAASALCLALLAGSFYWNNFAAARYRRIMEVSYARVGLHEISNLQRIHFIRRGHYAASLGELSTLSPDPKTFLADMDVLFKANSLSLAADQKSYSIIGRASDDNNTLVALRGP